jgi:hypothetical protein
MAWYIESRPDDRWSGLCDSTARAADRVFFAVPYFELLIGRLLKISLVFRKMSLQTPNVAFYRRRAAPVCTENFIYID